MCRVCADMAASAAANSHDWVTAGFHTYLVLRFHLPLWCCRTLLSENSLLMTVQMFYFDRKPIKPVPTSGNVSAPLLTVTHEKPRSSISLHTPDKISEFAFKAIFQRLKSKTPQYRRWCTYYAMLANAELTSTRLLYEGTTSLSFPKKQQHDTRFWGPLVHCSGKNCRRPPEGDIEPLFRSTVSPAVQRGSVGL